MAPLASGPLKRYRRGNLARNLDKLVKAQFEEDPSLPQGVKESLVNQWFYVHNDPRGAVVIGGLLRHRDRAFIDALRVRVREILDGLEELPLGVDQTATAIVQAVENNFVAAQQTVEDMVQAGASAVLSSTDPLATKEDLVDMGDRLERLVSQPARRVLILPSTLDEHQHRLLSKLKERHEGSAARLGEILHTNGISGLAAAVRSKPPWVGDETAAFWQATGRMLSEASLLKDAEAAFALEADCLDVDDPVEALVTAARCAQADGRPPDADNYLLRAKQIEAEHPSVELFVASRASAAVDRLQLTDAVTPRTDRQRSRRQCQRSVALMDLGRFEEGHEAALASLEIDPHGAGRELATLATIWRAQDQLPIRDRDDRPLIEAIQFQLTLYDQAVERGKSASAGVAGARAALATAVLGDIAATKEAIDRVLNLVGGLDEEEAQSTLASTALMIGDPERARKVLGECDGSPKSRVLTATILLMAGDHVGAANQLDQILSELEPGELRNQALRTRLAASADPNVPLALALEEELPDAAAEVAATRAQRALASGDPGAARAAVAAFDDPASLAIRSEIAEGDGKLPEAIGLQLVLARKHRSAANMLRLAALRARSGDFAGAVRDAMRLATDDRKVRSARDAAFEIAAQAAIDGHDFEELEDIADRWAELSPERPDPLWAQLFAITRQERQADALRFARRHDLGPTLEGNRHRLFAELYLYGISDTDERLSALRDLSDMFDRPLDLEQAFVMGFLTTPENERTEDEALIARFQETTSTMEDRFPDSKAFTSIDIDPEDDGEAIIDKLAAIQGAPTQEQVDALEEMIAGVRQGRLPVGFLAGMAGKGMADTIIRGGAFPLAVLEQPTHQTELAAAGVALDGASASWDETACITVGQLADAHIQILRSLLAGSLIGMSVRDSLVQAVRAQPAGQQVAMMQVAVDGTPQIVELDPAMVKRARDAETAAAQIAETWTPTTDHGLGDDRLATFADESDLPAPPAACVAALLVAREHGQPLYSDDRALRGFARGFGLPAFGTIALIDAAVHRGLIEQDIASDMLTAVIDLGVWSVNPDPGAYVGIARRAGFDLGRCFQPLLGDEVLLSIESRFTHNALLLAALAEEADDRLEQWATAMLASYREYLNIEPVVAGSLLLAAQLDPNAEEVDQAVRDRITKIAIALRGAKGLDPSSPDGDPVTGAIRRWTNVVGAPDRDRVVERLLSQLDSAMAAELRPRLEPGPED